MSWSAEKKGAYAAAWMREWRKRNREKVNALNRKSYARNREKRRARARAKYAADPEYGRRKHYATYGLSLEEYRAKLAAQNNQCAICQAPVAEGSRASHLDHCHDCDKVRTILCIWCNTAVGKLEKRGLATARALMAYVEQHAVECGKER